MLNGGNILKYQNLAKTTKIVRGVTIRPREIKEISGVVNSKDLIRVTSDNIASKYLEQSEPAKLSKKSSSKPNVADKNNDQEVVESNG